MRIAVASGLSILLLIATVANADASRAPLFSCSLGAKRISVTKSGGQFVYHFGTASKDEMTIEGVPASGNIFRLSQRFDGEENQIRFRNGEFSYIVYSTSGNPSVGGKAIAGLVVKHGADTVSDLICSRFTDAVFVDEDYSRLPEDSAPFAAM